CTLEIEDLETRALVESRRFALDGPADTPPGEYQLQLAAYGAGGLMELELERLELVGVTPVLARASTPRGAIARALVEGRPGEALRALGPASASEPLETRTLRAVALTGLGRRHAAADALARLLATSGGEEEVDELLRLAPARYTPPLYEAVGDEAYVRLYATWRGPHSSNAAVPGHVRALLPALVDIDAIERPTLRAQLLVMRGELRMRSGDRAGARADFEARLELGARAAEPEGDELIGVYVKLAALAAERGDEVAALELARAALELTARPDAPPPELVIATLRARPELIALEGHPDWEALLGPDVRILYP
ncbi:MAG: hypothetical protein KC468_25995, partial [Myxococcales bacterium]|nr:hypothetical protein [Myxococcales bacterium]